MPTSTRTEDRRAAGNGRPAPRGIHFRDDRGRFCAWEKYRERVRTPRRPDGRFCGWTEHLRRLRARQQPRYRGRFTQDNALKWKQWSEYMLRLVALFSQVPYAELASDGLTLTRDTTNITTSFQQIGQAMETLVAPRTAMRGWQEGFARGLDREQAHAAARERQRQAGETWGDRYAVIPQGINITTSNYVPADRWFVYNGTAAVRPGTSWHETTPTVDWSVPDTYLTSTAPLTYRPVQALPQPQAWVGVCRVTRHAMIDSSADGCDVIERAVQDAMQAAKRHYEDERGPMPTTPEGTWFTWLREDRADYDSVQVGVGYTEETEETNPRVRELWSQWAGQGVQVQVARGRPRVPTPQEVQATAERQMDQLHDEALRWMGRLHDHALAMDRERTQQRDNEIAEARAEELLRTHLTEEQLADWERANRFEMISAEGNRYRIARGFQGNVYLLNEDGHEVERLCIHADSSMPEPDQVLAQKLLLENDEDHFRETANITRLHGGRLDPFSQAGAGVPAPRPGVRIDFDPAVRPARADVYADGERVAENVSVQINGPLWEPDAPAHRDEDAIIVREQLRQRRAG